MTTSSHLGSTSEEFVLCHCCDLLVQIPAMDYEYKALCPRCSGKLHIYKRQANIRAALCALVALFMLVIASSFLFIHISINGIYTNIKLTDIPFIVSNEGYMLLAIMLVSFIMLLPIYCLFVIILLSFSVVRAKSLIVILLKNYGRLKNWCMAEIFLTGILVSFVKLMSYGNVEIDESFIAYVFFALLQVKAFSLFDEKQIWDLLSDPMGSKKDLRPGESGLLQGIRLCRCCHALLPIEQQRCFRCSSKGTARNRQSVHWTLALVTTAILIYIPANIISIMLTVSFGSAYDSNIMSGVIFMWNDGAYPVAMIIFIASIMIPTLKIMGLIWLSLHAQKCIYKPLKYKDCQKMQMVYNVIELVGKWSMIDIFVVVVLSSLIRMGKLMSIYPDVGVILFAMVVIITMIAVTKFDMRLLWDRLVENNYKNKRL